LPDGAGVGFDTTPKATKSRAKKDPDTPASKKRKRSTNKESEEDGNVDVVKAEDDGSSSDVKEKEA
jgi:hypothetical protein